MGDVGFGRRYLLPQCADQPPVLFDRGLCHPDFGVLGDRVRELPLGDLLIVLPTDHRFRTAASRDQFLPDRFFDLRRRRFERFDSTGLFVENLCDQVGPFPGDQQFAF